MITHVLQAWESDEAIEEDMPESPGTEKHDKEKDLRDSKKNRGRKYICKINHNYIGLMSHDTRVCLYSSKELQFGFI